MKKIFCFKYLLFALLLAIGISACDDMKEDVSPKGANTLTVSDDAFTTYQNQGINLDVLANDTYGSAAKITFGKPKNGALSIGQAGMAFYQPDSNYIGADSLTYTACIGNNCAVATIRINVLDPATCTIYAADDQYTVSNDADSYLNVLQNDTTCGGNLIIDQHPAHGFATVDNGQIIYKPDTSANYTGPVHFTYKLNSTLTANAGFATARVYLTLTANCILNAVNDQVSVRQDKKILIQPLLNDSHCGGSLTKIQQPLKGSFVRIGNALEYTPLPGVTGLDSIRYTIAHNGISKSAKITINILSNATLVCVISATNDYRTTLQGLQQSLIVPVLNNDQDCGATVTITRQPTPTQGQAALTSNNEIIFIPNPNFTGVATMEYSLSGPNGWATAILSIKILPNYSTQCSVNANDDLVTFQNSSQPMDSVMVPILNNDVICQNGATPTISMARQSNYGMVKYRGSGLNTYLVYYIYSGLQYYTDSCQYTICQGTDCDTATVIVKIQ